MDKNTSERLQQKFATMKEYTLVLLKAGPNIENDNAQQKIWEHGARNLQLQNEGLMPIICPIFDESELSGVAIFTTDEATTESLMKDDPAIQEGIFVFEMHPCKSFPGDRLP